MISYGFGYEVKYAGVKNMKYDRNTAQICQKGVFLGGKNIKYIQCGKLDRKS